MSEQSNDTQVLNSDELYRRRRARNIAIAGVIFGLCALFYVITILKVMNQ